jgi:predicted permease
MDISSFLGLFIVMQAAMPSAVSLPLLANLRKADSEFISQSVLFTHIISIVTVPLWLGLYMNFSHLSF